MAKKFLFLLSATALMSGVATLVAQEKTGEGTLMLQDKNYTLSHALAYETTVNGEEAIAVVLSGSAISGEDLDKSRKEEKEGGFAAFKRPYLILDFTKAGQLTHWSAASTNTSIGRRTAGKATGELKIQDGKVSGKASQPRDAEGMFPTAFDVRFDVKLLAAGESLPATVKKPPGPAANVKPTVTGMFKGNGKEAKLAYVSARWREPFGDKQSIQLVFTEKDHSKVKKPDFDAGFGKFGNALIISLHEDGNIFGCQVVHSAHKKQGFSAVGEIRTNNFKYEDGKVEGELLTDKELEFFGDTWEINLKFVAPLGEVPKEFQVPESKKPEEKATDKPKPQASEDADDDDDDADYEADEKPDSKPAANQLKVKDLALTKDAANIEYQPLVEHLLFRSKLGVKATVLELSANLKAQGWTKEGIDLSTEASTILKRKREGATLTIFVKPFGTGTEVKIMTEGLAWEK
ncbi:MAG: hypothetical protein DMF06_12820 [Verrucomicrobia bacterium]|nr:MAG: hypothetical protein DMF06_12820 [Verrucomicrobiota bacterium]